MQELNQDIINEEKDKAATAETSSEASLPNTNSPDADSTANSAPHPTAEQLNFRDQVIEAIKTVYDPEIPVNIYELGLIYEVNILENNNVDVLMTLTSPGCPAAGMLPGDVEEKVRSVPGHGDQIKVEVTFEPPWDQSMMTEEARLELGFL